MSKSISISDENIKDINSIYIDLLSLAIYPLILMKHNKDSKCNGELD